MKLTAIPQYELINKHYLKEFDSEGYLLRHTRSGARVFVLENSDCNKVFNIAFRTPPSDSTGVAHIIEHTVLCGSDKYPVKDPFIELAKGSLNTFVNAITYADKTMYPVASTNDKDFENLMSVYLDAVFHPNILKDRRIFEQEGWHYELDNPQDELKYNGVVYNEMKGAFSDVEDMDRYIKKFMYPDTAYAFESGGDPKVIPTLSYESYIEFYKKYYHPSNSYIYLYGDMDMAKVLTSIDDEYLKNYEKKEIESQLTFQEPFENVRSKTISYSADENSKKGFLTWVRSAGTALDKEKSLAFEVLEYVLLDAPGAPLRQALLDADMGDSIYGGYEDELLQPYFAVTAKGVDPKLQDKFSDIIRQTLEELVENGINRRSLLAGINSLDFRLREADFGRWPKGLMYSLDCYLSWIYDENDPFLHLETQETVDFLRQQLDTDYFERLIQTDLLDNKHGLLLAAVPKAGLDAENEAIEAQRLKDYKNTLSSQEINDIVRHTKELRVYQETPDSKEALETVPMLSLSDITRSVPELHNEMRSIADTDVLFHDINTSGIGYAELVFNADCLKADELQYMALLKNLFGAVATENYSYRDLTDEINIYTGGLDAGFDIYKRAGEKSPSVRFSFRIKALYDNLERAFELVSEVMLRSQLDDEKRLAEVIAETRSQLEESLRREGHTSAVRRATSYFSESGWLDDLTTGVAFLQFLDGLDKGFGEKKAELIRALKFVTEHIFTKDGLIISYTADSRGYEKLKPCVERLTAALPERRFASAERNVIFEKKNEGICCQSQIQFVARAGSFANVLSGYSGHLAVLQNILNYDYLWTNVRVKGGAYGCFAGFNRDGEGYLASYMDPRLEETNEVFEQLPEYLESFDADERAMSRFIIGTISEMDIPKNPAAMGSRGLSAWQLGITHEQLKREREEVLTTTAADIRAFKDCVSAMLETGCVCVVGSEEKLKGCSLIKELVRLNA